MNKKISANKLVLLCSATVLTPLPAMAQDNAAPAAQSGVQEIIVTARRTAENIQTTPVAVTAVGPEALKEKQIVRMADLTSATPSFVAVGGGTAGPLVGNFSIRGQAQANPGSGNDSPVAVYIDGVYQARPMVGNSGLLDVASAEVLRGPQGTLFGRNTTGGAFNITTQAPKDFVEGYAQAGYGNYDHYEFEGMLNVPLSSTLAVRFAGRYDESEGFVQNRTSGLKESGVDSSFTGRASLLWTPDSVPVTLRVTADHTRYRGTGMPTVITADDGNVLTNTLNAIYGTNIPAGALVSDPDNFFVDYGRTVAAGSYANTVFGLPEGAGFIGNSDLDDANSYVTGTSVYANLDIELGDITIKSITGYKETRNSVSVDLDGSPLRVISFFSDYPQEQWSQELQVQGSSGDLDWVFGGIYFEETGFETSRSHQFADLGNPFPFALDLTDFKSTSKGLFAQVNYQATDRLRVTGGIRYTWDKRVAVRHGRQAGTLPDYSDSVCSLLNPDVPGVCDETNRGKFSYPAWLASVDYEINDDTFVYLKTSGASLAGGSNFRLALPGNESFAPEDVRDVEVGLKTDLLDRRLRVNIAAFHVWRKGIQVNVNPTVQGRTTQFQINGGDARQYGAEFEATVVPWEGMTINANVSYLNSKYVDGSFIVLTQNGAATPNDTSDDFYDRSGELVTQAPEWTWSISGTQDFDVPFGVISMHADYSYHSSYAFYQNTLDPTVTGGFLSTQAGIDRINQLGLVPGEGLLNGRLAVTFNDPEIELSLWGRNLTNEKYFSSPFTGLYAAAGFTTSDIGAPRTYGVTARYSW